MAPPLALLLALCLAATPRRAAAAAGDAAAGDAAAGGAAAGGIAGGTAGGTAEGGWPHAPVTSLAPCGKRLSAKDTFALLDKALEAPAATAATVVTAVTAATAANAAGDRRARGALSARRPRAAPSLPPPTFFLDFIFERFGNGSHNLSLHGLSALMEQLQLLPHGHEDGDEATHMHEDGDTHVHGDEAALGDSVSAWDTVCLGPAALLQLHGLQDAAALSRPDFALLCPALLQQQLSGACADNHEEERPDGQLSTAERYVYGSLATLVVCLCSVCGIALLLCRACAGAHRYVIQLFVSLAVGSLTGDALLHLVPQFLGLHSHADGDHGHHEGDAEATAATWKLLAVLGGLYGFFLLERLFGLLVQEPPQAAGHAHCDHAGAMQLCEDELRRRKQLQGSSCDDLVRAEDPPLSQSKQELQSRELRLLPYMITIGDGIHNFADGLAMGAAFAASWRTGLATSLAVLCHELPHELGDFAALLHAGLSVRRALLLNAASALTAFLGLYIALAVATSAAFQAWIFPVATGLFLHVALCDLLPAMLRVRDSRPWLLFALHNVGLLAGWALLLLLSLYEENIVL